MHCEPCQHTITIREDDHTNLLGVYRTLQLGHIFRLANRPKEDGPDRGLGVSIQG